MTATNEVPAVDTPASEADAPSVSEAGAATPAESAPAESTTTDPLHNYRNLHSHRNY